LHQAYFAALERLPSLVAAAANRERDGAFLPAFSAPLLRRKVTEQSEAAQELTQMLHWSLWSGFSNADFDRR
jgi:hypothetical protein